MSSLGKKESDHIYKKLLHTEKIYVKEKIKNNELSKYISKSK